MLKQNQQAQNKLNLGKIIHDVKFGKLRKYLSRTQNIIAVNSHLSSYSIHDLAMDNFRMIEDLNTGKIATKGLASGFVEFDRITSGLQNSDLIVISGRTGVGKTSFALNISKYAAMKNKIPVLYFSLETPKNELLLKVLSSEAKVDLGQIYKGFLSAEDWMKLKKATENISLAPLLIVDEPAIPITALEEIAWLQKEKTGLGLIVVDNVQLAHAEGFRSSKEREISEIIHSLKALAMKLKIPLIAISQLNRKSDDDRPFYPKISDLRDSGAIEQDADIVLFICQEKVRKKNVDNPDEKITEIIIGKHRKGLIGSFKLLFVDKFTTFENIISSGVDIQTPKETENKEMNTC